MLTIAEAIATFGVPVGEHLDRQAQIPVLAGLQFQGDVAIVPRERPPASDPVPAGGVAVVPGAEGVDPAGVGRCLGAAELDAVAVQDRRLGPGAGELGGVGQPGLGGPSRPTTPVPQPARWRTSVSRSVMVLPTSVASFGARAWVQLRSPARWRCR